MTDPLPCQSVTGEDFRVRLFSAAGFSTAAFFGEGGVHFFPDGSAYGEMPGDIGETLAFFGGEAVGKIACANFEDCQPVDFTEGVEDFAAFGGAAGMDGGFEIDNFGVSVDSAEDIAAAEIAVGHAASVHFGDDLVEFFKEFEAEKIGHFCAWEGAGIEPFHDEAEAAESGDELWYAVHALKGFVGADFTGGGNAAPGMSKEDGACAPVFHYESDAVRSNKLYDVWGDPGGCLFEISFFELVEVVASGEYFNEPPSSFSSEPGYWAFIQDEDVAGITEARNGV